MSFKKFFKMLGWILLFSLFILIVISFFALQSSPHIVNQHTVDVKAATQSKVAAKRLIESVKSQRQPVMLELSQHEANGLSALANRALPQLISNVSISSKQAVVDISIALPFPKIVRYLNVSGVISPSEQGLKLGKVDIGDLSLSGDTLVSMAAWVIDMFVQDELGTNLVEMIQWVKLSDGNIKTSLAVPQDMTKLNDDSSALLDLRDKLSLFGDVEHIRFYYRYLVSSIDSSGAYTSTTLPYYVQQMFLAAKKQSELNFIRSGESLAVKENHAALMALSLYFGADSFELLVGDVSQLTPKQSSKRRMLQSSVTLKNRVDLQKHFMYSVALQLFGNTTASDTIGEFKEFLDSNPGGSGFSFADLTADRAGTRLAQLATESENSAEMVQFKLTQKLEEEDFMPDVTDIPEGISAENFEKEYGNVNSSNYQTMLFFIDSQLAGLTLYETE